MPKILNGIVLRIILRVDIGNNKKEEDIIVIAAENGLMKMSWMTRISMEIVRVRDVEMI